LAETFDINAFIEQAKAARAAALKKKEAAERLAAQKKADTAAARGIQNQANNKFQYADSLGNTLKDFEGQLRIFGTKIARGDELTATEQKDFDRLTKEYKKVSTAYSAALNEGNAILAKMPKSFAKEKKETETKAGVVKEEAPVEEKGPISLTDFLKSAIGNVEKTKKLQQALKDAKVYKGPINGIFNADVLLPAAEKAEERLDRFASLGIVFADRFEGYKRLATSGTGGDGTGGAANLPSRNVYEYTEAQRLDMLNKVSQSLRGQDITEEDKKQKWYKELKKSIDNMISTGTVTTTSKVVNPLTKKLETKIVSKPGFSEEELAATAEKTIRKAKTEDVALKESVDFTGWLLETLGGR